MLKITAKLIIFFLIIPMTVNAVSAESAILIDSGSGRILYEQNAYEKLPMASTTKIMTGLLACESEKLNENVKVSAFASGTEGSSLWLKIGEKQTLENLTYGLMLKSGNDAAVAIAEYLAGNTDAFALLMNERARELGAVNTNFENPHGLDSSKHYTTAYDLAVIAKAAMKNESFRKIVSTKTYSIPMQGENWDRVLKNHNKLLWNYEGCIGVKTGFTKKSGRCLVSCALRDGQELICVTLNAPNDWSDHKTLLDYGFENFKAEAVTEKGKAVCKYTYDKKNGRKVDLLYGEDFVISKSENDKITTKTEIKGVSLPSKEGTVAGYVHIFCNGKEIKQIPIVTAENIKELTIFEKIKNFFTSIFK